MLSKIPEDYVYLSSESSLDMRMGKEAEINPVLKWTQALVALSLKKKGSLNKSRRVSNLVEAITSWFDGRRREESFEE